MKHHTERNKKKSTHTDLLTLLSKLIPPLLACVLTLKSIICLVPKTELIFLVFPGHFLIDFALQSQLPVSFGAQVRDSWLEQAFRAPPASTENSRFQ